MDPLASFDTLPLSLAKNQVIVSIEPPDPVTNRAQLLYNCEIYIPEAYGSGFWTLFQTLKAKEAPAHTVGNVTYIDPVNLDIAQFLWGALEPTPPSPSQTGFSQQPMAVMPYYTKTYVEPLAATTTVESPIQYAIRAKINETQFAKWRELFFVYFFKTEKKFLTWQPNNKLIDRHQPEFLSFLVHHNPAPQQLKVRVQAVFVDGTIHPTFTAFALAQVSNLAIYTAPVGFKALGLEAIELNTAKEIHHYHVWFANQNTERLTEMRRYVLNQEYTHYVRYLVFCNSLGGFDTLRAHGVSFEQLAVQSTTFQRQLPVNYTADDGELFVFDSKGIRTLVINTGNLPNKEWLRYLEELAWSEHILLQTADGFVPIVRTSNAYDLPNDEEDLAGRTFTFRFAKEAVAFSNLPQAPTVSPRSLAWLPIFPFCEIFTENGKRTGRQAFAKLELRYADGPRERFGGIARKDNVPSTDGYFAPANHPSCAAPAFLNVQVAQTSLIPRNDCPAPQIGLPATTTVAAGQYGSEVSQADADTRALNALLALDTQAYANANGACIMPLVEVEGETATVSTGNPATSLSAPAASNGLVIFLGGNPSEYVDIAFTLPATRTWTVEFFHYSKGGPNNFDIRIDGVLAQTLAFPNAGDFWTFAQSPAIVSAAITITTGSHTMRLVPVGNTNNRTMLDKIKFS